MKPLLLLALACALQAAPAQRTPAQTGWTLDQIRAALARVEQVPPLPRGVLVLPLTTADGKPLETGGTLALLAMLAATNVPRQVLAPDAWSYLSYLPGMGWYEASPLPAATPGSVARKLEMSAIARGVASDAGPEPELTLTIEGAAGKKEFKHRAKLAALVPWIALRIHEYLGTALTPDARAAIEATAIPDAEPARLGEALRRYARSGPEARLALTRAVAAEFPARPECWLLLVAACRSLSPADLPQVVAAGRAAFPGHPYLTLVQVVLDEAGSRWNDLMTVGFQRLAEDWRQESVLKQLMRASNALPVAGGADAIAGWWSKREPKSARALAFLGQTQLDAAYRLRGTGWASEVRPEAWPRIRALAESAVEIAERAHQLDPKAMEPVTLMLSAQMLHGDKAVAAAWFEKGRNIDPGNYTLHSLYLMHLQPRWGGTEDGMLTWARAVARTAPPEGCAPLVLWLAHQDIASYRVQTGKLLTESQYLGEPAVYADLKSSLERMLSVPQEFLTERDLLARALLCAYWAGARDDAKRLLERIGDNYGLSMLTAANFKRIQEWAVRPPPARGDGKVAVKLTKVGRYKLKAPSGFRPDVPVGMLPPGMLTTEFTEDTRRIPCKVGEAFGMQVEVTVPAGGSVRCDTLHPPMTLPDGRVRTESRGRPVRVAPGGTFGTSATWMFLQGYAYELVPGKWTKKVFVDDKEVASETFELVP